MREFIVSTACNRRACADKLTSMNRASILAAGILLGASTACYACSAAQNKAFLDLTDEACVAVSVFAGTEQARKVCATEQQLRPFVESALDQAAKMRAQPGSAPAQVCVAPPGEFRELPK
jgi:hypothetical protein